MPRSTARTPVTTPDWVNIDHRPETTFAGRPHRIRRRRLGPHPDISVRIEAVHRLNDLGAVVTYCGHGTSQEGFDAEWREIDLLRSKATWSTAARCSTRRTSTPRSLGSKNCTRRHRDWKTRQAEWTERFLAYLAARDWDAAAETLADDFSRTIAVAWWTRESGTVETPRSQTCRRSPTSDQSNMTSTVIATRGERLVLSRADSGPDQGPEAFLTEVLGVVEINADERIVADVTFDLDDFDAAFAELDARYLAGEAAAHAHTWSVITGAYAAFNRHEFPATEPD